MKPIAVLKAVAFAAALLPAAALAYGYYTDDLTANPGDYITDQTGTWTLAMLVISLTVTPLRRITKWNELIKLRRMLGLFAFFYVLLHFTTWLVLDKSLSWTAILDDLWRPFIVVGARNRECAGCGERRRIYDCGRNRQGDDEASHADLAAVHQGDGERSHRAEDP